MSVSKESIEPKGRQPPNPSLNYRLATLADCDSVCKLINSAYRGESSCQGWTTEAGYLEGQRIDNDMLTDIIREPKAVILVFFEMNEAILIGCAHLRHKDESDSAYLGLLTVRPDSQSRGYGKLMMSMAESYASENWHVAHIEITVVTLRLELIAYYNRRGYFDTGLREPFPMDDPKYGLPKRRELEFCVMRKNFKKS